MGSNERFAIWSATDRAISVNKGATIDEVSQAIISKLVLSDDFPHTGIYPCATLSVKVKIVYIIDKITISY